MVVEIVQGGNKSVIVNGLSNTTSGVYNFIGTGCNNLVTGANSAIVTGYYNKANGNCTFIGGGCRNTGSAQFSVVVGGHCNVNAGTCSFIGSGYQNSIKTSCVSSAILGGRNNCVQHNCSFVIGANLTSSAHCTTFVNSLNVSGSLAIPGFTDVSASLASVSGVTSFYENGTGNNSTKNKLGSNLAGSTFSYVGSGILNVIDSNSSNSAIVGGRNNLMGGTSSTLGFIGGGCLNTGSAGLVAIVGGCANQVGGAYGFIGGGQQNIISDAKTHSTIGGGCGNTASELFTTIAGGKSNTVSNCYGSVGGGINNSNSGRYSAIVGGDSNCITTNSLSSTISGGYKNKTCSAYSTISGGYENLTEGSDNTISGGYCNKILGADDITLRSTIGGGGSNCISGSASNRARLSVIAGGGGNDILNANFAHIGGGGGNKICANYSTISGGYENCITSTACFSGTVSGYYNCLEGKHSILGGGHCNHISSLGECVAILGGQCNIITASFANAISGNDNHRHSVIAGGHNNTINVCREAGESQNNPQGCHVIVGGECNEIFAHSTSQGNNFIGGGCKNKITGSYYINFNNIVGGSNNFVGGVAGSTQITTHSNIVGGQENYIENQCFSNIVGGYRNKIFPFSSGQYGCMNSIVGGCNNQITGSSIANFIGGGEDNIIRKCTSGINQHNSILGGKNNEIKDDSRCSNIIGHNNTMCSSECSTLIGSGNSIAAGADGIIGIGHGMSLGTGQANTVVISNLCIFGTNGSNGSITGVSAVESGVGIFGTGTTTIDDDIESTGNITITGSILAKGAHVSASSFIKNGGTSAQFLKADGSVDSSTYSTATGVEDNADVTNATNVAAAGALMDGDFTSNGFLKRTGAGAYTVDTNTYLTNVNLASNVTGQLPEANGGTGATSLGDIALSSFDDDLSYIALTGNQSASGTKTFTGQIVIGANGTISAPMIRFPGSSTNTGFYSSNPDEISITIGGAQKIVFNSGTSEFKSHLRAHCLGVGGAAPGTPGEIWAYGDVVANYSSDKRLKKNIKPISSALDKLLQISGVEFDWIEKKEVHSHKGHDVGVIAQEVEEILPEVVVTRDNGYKAVNYEKIVPLLIEAIKDLKAEVDELKKSK